MQLPGNAAQGKSQFGRKNITAASQYLSQGTSPRNGAEETNEKKGLEPLSVQANSAGVLLLDASLHPRYANPGGLVCPDLFGKSFNDK